MARRPIETTEWVGQRLCEAKSFGAEPPASGFEVVESNILRVVRENRFEFTAGIINEYDVKPIHVEGLVKRVEMVVNVPARSVWRGDAIKLIQEHGRSFGGMKEIMAACNVDEVSEYVRPEFQFFEDRIVTHRNVDQFERLTDRLYLLHRKNHSPKRIVLLNEYELSGPNLWDAAKLHGPFDIVHHTNPNGKVLADGLAAGKTLEVAILKLGDLFRRLNLP